MNGEYDLQGVIWHQHSNKLLVAILDFWKDKSIPVMDLGCGHNFYMNVMRVAGYVSWGIDSFPLDSIDQRQDITMPIEKWGSDPRANFQGSFSKINVLSLEVGEHIPADLAEGYLDNITKFKGDVLMSWALPGQAGHGHINCKPNSWVIEEMRKRGYDIDFQRTHELRQAVAGCHCTWFIHTLMYFKPKL